MLTAVVTTSSTGLAEVSFLQDTFLQAEEEAPTSDLNPIAPEVKEIVWGFGAFIVLLIALRYWLFPKVRDGMQARYESIQSDKESADTLTAAARADVAEYEARLTSVRAEAQQKVDAARATLESERTEKLGAVNDRTAEKRAAANAEVESAREAAMGDVESAVIDVVTRATEIATGRPADPDTVQAAVRSSMDAQTSGTAA